MAKKKKNSPAATEEKPASKPVNTTVMEPFSESHRLFLAGDAAGARRHAQGVLARADASEEDKKHAQAVLEMVKLDWQPAAVWGAMILVLGVVFINAIILRNGDLKELGPAPDLNKAIIRVEPVAPPTGTVPAAPMEENRGTP